VLIGGCNLCHTSKPDLSAMIGYTINRDYWRNGYTTEAAAALLELGFTDAALHRITSWCTPENTGSWKVMEKIGMRREGHEREAVWFKGKWHDWLRYALLDYEWFQRQSALRQSRMEQGR
jgi:RimJ/RimL family protein N-acetyltransferase